MVRNVNNNGIRVKESGTFRANRFSFSKGGTVLGGAIGIGRACV
jgi:hypothetical protein